MPEKPVGKVEHYYPKAKAAAVGLTDDLKVGDEIHIVGHGDDVRAKVKSLQLDHQPIQEGHAGQHIGVGLSKKVHEGDDVLLVSGASASSAGGAKAPARKAAAKARKAPTRKAARKPARKAARGKRAKAARRKPARKAARKATRKPKRAKAKGKAPRRAARKSGRKATRKRR